SAVAKKFNANRRKMSAAPPQRDVIVLGARQHNLKGIDATIPRDKMTVCCGMSGSGKTSLAMDTIYAEGQRRYVESLSSYARQFVAQMQKPQLEHIEGLSPAIAIEQKHMGHTPRSTVGTVTEIYDYFRILFARIGEPHCPECEAPIGTQTSDQIVDNILAHPEGTKLYLMAPMEVRVGESYEALWDDMRSRGYLRIRVDGETFSVDEAPTIDRRRKHRVEIVIDRIVVKQESRGRIADSIENALALGQGVMTVAVVDENRPETDWPVEVHSQHFACDRCGRSFELLTPHSFSFNSRLGWCESCEGLGVETGANPAALIRDAKLTLAQGAVLLWPQVGNGMFAAMLSALSAATGIAADVPLDHLTARQRRTLLHGAGDRWFDVPAPGGKKSDPPLFRFQYKGLYPALDEASRLSPKLRQRLEQFTDEVECSACDGSRLRDDASAMRLRGKTIADIARTPLGELQQLVEGWEFDERERRIAGELIREIRHRLQFLVDVGLDYLSIGRAAPTLSGGESQRIRLASQVGSGLCGVLYVLDEPTIGLHARDNRKLITALEKLRDLGNTLLLVEHDREVVESADQLLDFGPRAGDLGGEIVARGTPAQVAKKRDSVTGPYLSGKKAIPVPTNRRPVRGLAPFAQEDSNSVSAPSQKGPVPLAGPNANAQKAPVPFSHAPRDEWIEIVGARHNNLRGIDVAIPLGTLTTVTGVSGSGKSSLVEDVLYNALAKQLHRASTVVAAHDEIRGIQHINKVIRVDQQPLGNSPTSNPATYTGMFELIRQLYAQLPDAKVRGYTARRFSFNVPGGRCEACEGNGQVCIEMHFLPDVWVECETCRGRRYNPETLAVRFHGQSISDVLDMSCAAALQLFANIPKIRRILQMLCDVGLDYVKLGQPAPTLSGGEAQRVKLASELARPDTGRTLYLLDEPTTGLHFEDIGKLLDVLNRLVDLGNTVVVIEHNLDVIKTADWVIDIGPEAGAAGGQLVAAGTPEQIAEHAGQVAKSNGRLRSYTGEVLAPVLAAGPHAVRPIHDFEEELEKRAEDLDITDVG
ncbi:MAG: ATP-binding cassette domain-containing protein, partial [Pirellulales bacterium]